MKEDIKAAEDRGEMVSLMEPLLIGEGSRHRGALTDLAFALGQKSTGFRRSLPESLLSSLTDGIIRITHRAVHPRRISSDRLVRQPVQIVVPVIHRAS
jgi:hypothetical protein